MPDSPVVHLRELTHQYGSGKPALENVSLTVLPGERVGLVGPSGAGKSTLLRVVNGLVTPSSGEVITLDENPAALNDREKMHLRRQIGMIFQEFALIERLSALMNVLVGRLGYVPLLPSLVRRFPEEDVARARRALADVGLEGFEERLVRNLSGGQKQRVGIARALAQEARIVLADEPTANLDIRTADEVLGLLVRLGEERGVSMLLSLHDVRAARKFCTRIVALRSGKIVWQGDPASFTDEVVEEIFYAPAT